ncbi:hypothetical protein AX14_005838 [Amanita brunnescens Koide BX004]|nr:hypothetical protein AX14_005838 [Amanita brunnescens Koide BX004]
MNVGGSYDESLLREAPAATREQLQEGYNPDLLVTPTRHKSVRHTSPLLSTPPGAAAPALPSLSHPHGSDMEQGNIVSTGKSSHSYDLLREKSEGSRDTPFWATTSGKILIAVIVALVIIGAVVGGAVGGTVGHKSNKRLSTSSAGPQAQGNSTGSTVAPVGTQTAITPGATTTSTFTSIAISIPLPASTQGTSGRDGLGGLAANAMGASTLGVNQEPGSNPTV